MSGRIGLAGLATCLALACGGGNGGDTGTPTGTNPPPTGDIQVGNNFFNPTSFSVAAGATVAWFWDPGGVTHNVVFDDGAPGSGNQSSGTFERTFTAPGTYAYHCSIHGAAVMSGAVTVTGDGETTGGGTPPSGTPPGGMPPGGTPPGGYPDPGYPGKP